MFKNVCNIFGDSTEKLHILNYLYYFCIISLVVHQLLVAHENVHITSFHLPKLAIILSDQKSCKYDWTSVDRAKVSCLFQQPVNVTSRPAFP